MRNYLITLFFSFLISYAMEADVAMNTVALRHAHCGRLMHELIDLSGNQDELRTQLFDIASRKAARSPLELILKTGLQCKHGAPHGWAESHEHCLCRRIIYFLMWKSDRSVVCMKLLEPHFGDIYGLHRRYHSDTRNWLYICAFFQDRPEVLRYLGTKDIRPISFL